ncbi:hypothetical protein B0A48_00273 [Cryoendolithus antarcticus]|uniref:GST C-terminal domain-containing protein n=1 Tax=Cryoendolithus antarcticus TaxID=1507870 RepID=A0A1V8TUD0_9PEZI|nr:hypothetical protein B0A48_00273 [Cryoendolithus antarcticus]
MSGRDALEQAKVQEWLSYISATFTITGFTQIFRPTRVVGEAAFEGVLQAVRNFGYEIVVAGLYHVETRLDDSGFAVGYHLTVVDFLLWTVWGWADRAGLRTQTDRVSKLRGVVERVGKVERLQDVLAREKGEDRAD